MPNAFPFGRRFLEVDLTSGRIESREVELAHYETFFAGSGLAAKMFYDEDAMRAEPLAPEAKLMFAAGLLTGTVVPAACKMSVCFRSPLTNIWCESTVGGHFPAQLKSCGIDGLIISGKATRPVFLEVSERGARLCDAQELWGRNAVETSDLVKTKTGEKFIVAAIGPAGENQVPFSSITCDGPIARAAGRGGGGAVMGSKNLKAIAVCGRQRPRVADPARLKRIVAHDNPSIRNAAATLAEFSTAGGVERHERLGNMPLKNWSLGSWPDGAARIAAQYFLPRTFVRHYACFSCPIGCGKIVRIRRGAKGRDIEPSPLTPLPEGEGNQVHIGHAPEYEACAGFGGNCLCDNYETILQANLLCDELGLDTISTSNVIAFAMEAFERGRLTPADTDGLELHWGNGTSMLELIRLIAARRGLGALLSRGVRNAAETLGLEGCAIHVKGLEMAYHDPRAFTCMAAKYATANRGACHLESLGYFLGGRITLPALGYPASIDRHSNEGMGKVTFDMQNYLSVFNPLGLCKFLLFAGVDVPKIVEWLRVATGWEVDVSSLLQTGERIFNLKRLVNVRLGVGRRDDVLPPRVLREPRPDGGSAGVLPDLGKMLNEYYSLRGWDATGRPAAGTSGSTRFGKD